MTGLLATVLTVDSLLLLALLLTDVRRPRRLGRRGRRPAAAHDGGLTRPARDAGPRPRSVSGVVPAAAGADRHVEGHGELGGPAHLAADDLLERVALPRRDLEDELVVHLEQHP